MNSSANSGSDAARSGVRFAWYAAIGAGCLIALLAFEAVRTRPVRRTVRAYTELIAAANRQDLARARGLCSARYLGAHRLEAAPHGGIIGLPRGISPNFRAWRQAGAVLLCPTNRVGPIYRFVPEAGDWKFDGLVGVLRSDGRAEVIGDDRAGS